MTPLGFYGSPARVNDSPNSQIIAALRTVERTRGQSLLPAHGVVGSPRPAPPPKDRAETARVNFACSSLFPEPGLLRPEGSSWCLPGCRDAGRVRASWQMEVRAREALSSGGWVAQTCSSSCAPRARRCACVYAQAHVYVHACARTRECAGAGTWSLCNLGDFSGFGAEPESVDLSLTYSPASPASVYLEILPIWASAPPLQLSVPPPILCPAPPPAGALGSQPGESSCPLCHLTPGRIHLARGGWVSSPGQVGRSLCSRAWLLVGWG